MTEFRSMSEALSNFFETTFDQLPNDEKELIERDPFLRRWDKMSASERQSRAKQWDFENDPCTREIREGLAAITDPDSPAYSEEETRRLRGDYLPEIPIKYVVRKDLPPLDFAEAPLSAPHIVAHSFVPERRIDADYPLEKGVTEEIHSNDQSNNEGVKNSESTKQSTSSVPAKKRRGVLQPVIEQVQAKCKNPFDTAEVWSHLEKLADDEVGPLLASTPEGIKYKENGKNKTLKRNSLRDRLGRMEKNPH